MKIKGNLALCLVLLLASVCWGKGIEEKVLASWTRSGSYSESTGAQNVKLKITYYSAEYIEALVRAEAEKNLWTKDEEERYKYNLLKTLNLDERIAFHFDIDVTGMPAYLQPFDRFLKLRIGKKLYEPVDYDKRFNFKLEGQRDGIVWFPRYDEKTGKSLLEGVKELRLVVNGAFSQSTASKGDILFVWNITGDDPSVLDKGRAAAKLELDRLIKRLDKLHGERRTLQEQLDTIDKELGEINIRVEELQKQ